MIQLAPFPYTPTENEKERASNSYLMSLLAVAVGLPLPIVNLFATLIFFLGNRRSSYFVRWHCTQALLSQLSLLFANSYGFWWTVGIIWGDDSLSSPYIAYMFTLFLFNLTEFIATIYTAVKIRKGVHVEWWLYGAITNEICSDKHE